MYFISFESTIRLSCRLALSQCNALILKTGITAALRQRILFVDWTDKASRIAEAAHARPMEPV